MPYKEKEIEKLYYTIGEVAQLFGVNTSHIRFWSNEFDVIRPATNKKGNRMYTRDDIENFRKIYHLVKEKGYTLRGAKTELREMKFKGPEETMVAENPDEMMQEVLHPENGTAVIRNNQSPEPSSASNSFSEDFVDRMALRTSLEKVRSGLLDLQKEMNQLANV